jgi:NAD(P)-dependent dehydrogenase (short-subunit alcohol dehydrogenase family)
MSRIENEVVAITGASSGIGEATALLLAERGAKVVLGARGESRLKALADRIAAAGGDVAYAATDVSRRDDVSNFVKLACEQYGKLDVLSTRRGVAWPARLSQQPPFTTATNLIFLGGGNRSAQDLPATRMPTSTHWALARVKMSASGSSFIPERSRRSPTFASFRRQA